MRIFGLFAFMFMGWPISYGIATLLWKALDLPTLAYFFLAFFGGLAGGSVATQVYYKVNR